VAYGRAGSSPAFGTNHIFLKAVSGSYWDRFFLYANFGPIFTPFLQNYFPVHNNFRAVMSFDLTSEFDNITDTN